MNWLERFFKVYAVPLFLFMIKILTALRTGIDTLIVVGAFSAQTTMLQFANDILYVGLIDITFTGFWLYAAYGGDSGRATMLRPFAIIGAWVLYAGMLVIGLEAHADNSYLAILVRVAGGLALGYDSWSYISGPFRQAWINTAAAFKNRFRAKNDTEVYTEMIQRAMIRSYRAIEPQVARQIQGVLVDRVSKEVPDVVLNRLPLPEQLGSGYRDEEEEEAAKRKQAYPKAIVDSWNTCKQNLDPEETFTRGRIETCTQLRRSRAADVISYGLSIGEVRKVGYGRYQYRPISPSDMIVDAEEYTPPTEGDF